MRKYVRHHYDQRRPVSYDYYLHPLELLNDPTWSHRVCILLLLINYYSLFIIIYYLLLFIIIYYYLLLFIICK